MKKRLSPRLKAILLAILVVMLWSTSWILIKILVEEVPSITLAGLRYSLAFFVLTPFVLTRKTRSEIMEIRKAHWIQLILLGCVYIALTQGAMNIALSILPTVTVSLILNFTSGLIAIAGMVVLQEKPTMLQWTGLIVNLIGILIYFLPFQEMRISFLGYLAAIFCLVVNTISALLSRKINREAVINPLLVTWISIGIGGGLLLITGISIQGLPPMSIQSILMILWLAVVNTAFAFPLWNYSLQHLTAMESSVINSLMLVFIAILAVLILGEKLDGKGIFGLSLASLGTYLVQKKTLRRLNRQNDI